MRNRSFFLFLPSLLLTYGIGSAEEHEHRQLSSHEHGMGQLNVAQESGALNIELISPAMNIVGFEHAPTTSEQEEALQSATKSLKDAEQIFSLPAEAQCQLAKVEVETNIADEHDEEQHEGEHEHEEHDDEKHGAHEDDDEHDEHDEEVHSEFHASYEFSCAKPDGLTHVDVSLFTLFPGTEELRVQLISGQGQSKMKLTADSARIEL